MRSAAGAFAWQFRQQHRWGLIAIAAYLFVVGIIRIFFVHRVTFHDDETFALTVIVPLTSTFLYFLAIFSFGLSGDIAGRQSIYPQRLFTLPLTTTALAGWPMLLGSVAMAGLWFATRLLGVWPSDTDVPVFWPALLGASLLAWTQALTWMAYGLPGLRVILTVLWLATIDAIVLLALNFRPSELVMLALLAPHVPLAFVVARFAVGRARRGDVPDWRPNAIASRGDDRHFASAAQAQRWFEWRQHGRSLPMLVAIVLPFELAMLFLFHNYPSIVMEILGGVMLTPPIMAIFVAGNVSGGLTSFMATRPIDDASLISSKLKAALQSTIATWLLVIAAAIAGLMVSGTLPIVVDAMQRLAEVVGVARAIAIVSLLFFAYAAWTWKQLVQSLCIVMTGREWLIKGSVFGALALLAVIPPAVYWILERHAAVAFLWNAFPWIIAALVCLKLGAAAWVMLRVNRPITLVVWNAAVFALFGLLAWIVPALLGPRYLLMMLAILAVPLVRVSAAPLALAWNRHR